MCRAVHKPTGKSPQLPKHLSDQSLRSLVLGMPLAVKVVRVEDKALLWQGFPCCTVSASKQAKRDQLINEIHTLFRITKSHFLIELYDA